MEATGTEARVARALVRLNAAVMATALGILASAGVFVATAVLLIRNGANPGPMLGLLAYFFPGYTVTWSGAFVGAFWGLLAGAAMGLVLGLAYGPWLLRGAVRALRARPRGRGADDPDAGIVILRPLPFALVTAVLASAALFLVTNWLSLRGWPSPTLGLLAHYLPGYTTDFTGSLVGAVWVLFYVFFAAGASAVIYDRVVALRTRVKPGL